MKYFPFMLLISNNHYSIIIVTNYYQDSVNNYICICR